MFNLFVNLLVILCDRKSPNSCCVIACTIVTSCLYSRNQLFASLFHSEERVGLYHIYLAVYVKMYPFEK